MGNATPRKQQQKAPVTRDLATVQECPHTSSSSLANRHVCPWRQGSRQSYLLMDRCWVTRWGTWMAADRHTPECSASDQPEARPCARMAFAQEIVHRAHSVMGECSGGGLWVSEEPEGSCSWIVKVQQVKEGWYPSTSRRQWDIGVQRKVYGQAPLETSRKEGPTPLTQRIPSLKQSSHSLMYAG